MPAPPGAPRPAAAPRPCTATSTTPSPTPTASPASAASHPPAGATTDASKHPAGHSPSQNPASCTGRHPPDGPTPLGPPSTTCKDLRGRLRSMSQEPPKLAQLNLLVDDMAASLDFYRRLGVTTADEEDGPHAELSLPGGFSLELDTAESVRRRGGPRRQRRRADEPDRRVHAQLAA